MASHDDDEARGTVVIALVATVYLATLAIGLVVFRAKPFVGGLAAVVAIVVGRALQVWLGPGTGRDGPREPPAEPRA